MKNVDKRVGVFMRVYRNEPEIHQAIISVLSQTYESIRYYILVNEKTIDLVNQYAQKDIRIEVIEGKEGEGFRDYAKKIARENAYVTTIDGDDWYEKTYIEELVDFAEKNHLDIVACGNYFVDPSTKIIGERRQIDMTWNRKDSNMVLEYFYAFFRTIWGKLMTAQTVLAYDESRLPDSKQYGGYGGDTIFIFNVLYGANRLGIINRVLYYYRISVTSSSYQLKQGRLDSDEILFKFVKKFLEEIGPVSEKTLLFLYQVYGNALLDTTKLVLNAKLDEKQRTQDLIYICKKNISEELLYRERNRKLEVYNNQSFYFAKNMYHMIFDSLSGKDKTENIVKDYLELFCILYPKWKDIVGINVFRVLLQKKELLDSFTYANERELFCKLAEELQYLQEEEATECLKVLQKINPNIALTPVLQNKEFVMTYADIIKKVANGYETEAVGLCREKFSDLRYPDYAELLIDLWINLAALQNNADAFVDGKKMKLKILIDCGKSEEARNELIDLEEMGIKC